MEKPFKTWLKSLACRCKELKRLNNLTDDIIRWNDRLRVRAEEKNPRLPQVLKKRSLHRHKEKKRNNAACERERPFGVVSKGFPSLVKWCLFAK